MIGVRLDPETEQRLAAVARREGRTKSDVVRAALRRYLEEDRLAAEARRQSSLVAVDASRQEEDVLRFIEATADWPADP